MDTEIVLKNSVPLGRQMTTADCVRIFTPFEDPARFVWLQTQTTVQDVKWGPCTHVENIVFNPETVDLMIAALRSWRKTGSLHDGALSCNRAGVP